MKSSYTKYSRITWNTCLLVFGIGVLFVSNGYANHEFRASHKADLSKLPKTAIKITYPHSQTIWTTADTVTLKWTTRNIERDKTIKFYLSKDDMVVQELGVFENSEYAEGIILHRGLPAGDNYRVIGIELFPDDKYSIAKYATAFFTIKKAPRPTKRVAPKPVEKPAKPVVRNTFEGRKLTYVKELTVKGKEIRINLWDHGRKDGDIVSIYLNGEAVVSEYYLEYRKKTFEVQLDPSKPNDLFLYAHNLGKFPPNTVSIEILDGTDSENIVLNSDLKSCEAVLINVEE
ncbi:hypothetical protein [Ulvibacterium sp.]|uniref:hypothetical protein n=1 Tax=Ulvibacterium sp. TaxID=2665914 RepID=UPI003BAC7881